MNQQRRLILRSGALAPAAFAVMPGALISSAGAQVRKQLVASEGFHNRG